MWKLLVISENIISYIIGKIYKSTILEEIGKLCSNMMFNYFCYLVSNLLLLFSPYLLLKKGIIVSEDNTLMYISILCIEIWMIKNAFIMTGNVLITWIDADFTFSMNKLLQRQVDKKIQKKNIGKRVVVWLFVGDKAKEETLSEMKRDLLYFGLQIAITFFTYSFLFHRLITPYLTNSEDITFPYSLINPFLYSFDKVYAVTNTNYEGSLGILFIFLFLTLISCCWIHASCDPKDDAYFLKFFLISLSIGSTLPFLLAHHFAILPIELLVFIFIFIMIKYLLWALERFREKE